MRRPLGRRQHRKGASLILTLVDSGCIVSGNAKAQPLWLVNEAQTQQRVHDSELTGSFFMYGRIPMTLEETKVILQEFGTNQRVYTIYLDP